MAGGAEAFDLPDPLIWLTWAAAHTERIRLATGVLVLPQRNVVVTAKEIATLDHLSGGRVDARRRRRLAGRGVRRARRAVRRAGRPARRVHRRAARAVGAERRRREVDRRRALRHVRATASCGPARRTARCRSSSAGTPGRRRERAGRRGDGFFPGSGTIEELAELFAIVRAEAEAAGRDPDAIELSTAAVGRPGPEARRAHRAARRARRHPRRRPGGARPTSWPASAPTSPPVYGWHAHPLGRTSMGQGVSRGGRRARRRSVFVAIAR